MKKSELIDAMASKSGLTKKDAGAALNAFTQTITQTLAKKDSVALIGFGTFSISERAERVGRNPSTGKDMKIPASTTAKFKAGSKLKEALNS
jgi:DNA-binding protein HU-beta